MSEETAVNELISIERYLNNEMSEEELTGFEYKLQNVAGFREKVRKVQLILLGISESVFGEQMNVFHAELENHHSQKEKVFVSEKWAILVTVILLLGIGIWFLLPKSFSGNSLYTDYFKPDPGLLTLMSPEQDRYGFERAMVDFKNGEYNKALLVWHEQLEQNPANDTLIYFVGAAYQAIGKYDRAQIYLQEIAGNEKSVFYRDANWFLGLLKVRSAQNDEAIRRLYISEYEKAEELIGRLTR